jgi:leucyl aminopeptidase
MDETVRRVEREITEKRIKKEFFTTLDARSNARNLIIYSTTLSSSYNVWENVKIFVRQALNVAKDLGLTRVSILLNTPEAAPFIGKAVEGAILGSYSFDKYKKDKSPLRSINVDLVALRSQDEQNRFYLNRYTIVSEAINEARDMINEPGSVATPEYLAETARRIAKEVGLEVKVWDEKKLEKDGYNGLLQVGRGSSNPPRLIRLSYRPKKSRGHLAFVGKGVTFDTGGISLKPADKMWEMKGDMSGGAAVMFAMKAIGKLKPDVNVTGIIPTAENSPDGNAQRPGDIFFAKNGKSIMVDNTDAEGRLILTDGLALASEGKPSHILDIATLTGAVVRALGVSIAGVMGNNPRLIQSVIRSGENHGESFWELPLPEEYKELLKTPCADLNNIGGPVAGALTAGLFLQEFVPHGVPWAHLDIAGPYLRDKDWKYYEAGAIGFGTKTLVDLAERFQEYLA